MPEIKIKSCVKTANCDALEAVRIWMYRNYLERDYKESRVVRLQNGNEIYVKEVNPKSSVDDNPCDGVFEVECVSQ